jgi:hypothetical protein
VSGTLPQIVAGGFGSVLLVAAAVLMAFALSLGGSSGVYDSIGAGIFDRARGDDGCRPPCDAEYEEFGAALAAACGEDDEGTRRTSGTRG